MGTVEHEFYGFVAPQLRAVGLETPEVIDSHDEGGERTLYLEYVPIETELAEYDSADIIGYLARLHESNIDITQATLYEHSWFDFSESVDRLFEARDRDIVCEHFAQTRERYGYLVEGRCPISGDANIRNWRRRATGQVLLLDWEAFSLGTPAMDLATLTPGLPDLAVSRDLAARYCEQSKYNDPECLAREIIAGVVWKHAWLLADPSSVDTLPGRLTDWLRLEYPRWAQRSMDSE